MTWASAVALGQYVTDVRAYLREVATCAPPAEEVSNGH